MSTEKKVFIAALSGGVDSTVAALIAKKKGYKLIGITLNLIPCSLLPESENKKCCGDAEKIKAANIAEKLDIPFKVLDCHELFREKVMRYSWKEYERGRTPNPCIMCNKYIKFGFLIDYAENLGAEGIITGHYANVINSPKHPQLLKGDDPLKDQAYFLSFLDSSQLNNSFFPLGNSIKNKVREIAEKEGLPNYKKAESQDACFGLGNGSFAEILRKTFNGERRPGKFVGTDGKILGKHDGIHKFTIGQRKGLGIALGKPAYVVKIDPDSAEITVSTDQSYLMSTEIKAEKLNILGEIKAGDKVEMKVRYKQKAVPAKIKSIKNNSVTAIAEKPIRAVSPGQAAVFYNEKQLVAAGWIS